MNGFAVAPNEGRGATCDLLAIRIGTFAFAVHLEDVKGLFADKPLTALPTPIPELLGVASFRGGLVAVYDLRALLGHETTAAPRWLVLVPHRDKVVGLAFDGFDGHRRVPADGIAVACAESSPHVREVVTTDADARAIVDIASVLGAIESRAMQIVRRER